MNGQEMPAEMMAARDAAFPPEFIELEEFRSVSVERRLGYFGERPFVIFGYCPAGGEVIWKDGRSSGFGGGGWKVFLRELVPAAARLGADLGDVKRIGTHVLWMDRRGGQLYAAPRHSAEVVLAQRYGIRPPERRCLCAMGECECCPLGVRGRCSRGGVTGPKPGD